MPTGKAFAIPKDRLEIFIKQVRREIKCDFGLSVTWLVFLITYELMHFAWWTYVLAIGFAAWNFIAGFRKYINEPIVVMDRLVMDVLSHPELYSMMTEEQTEQALNEFKKAYDIDKAA